MFYVKPLHISTLCMMTFLPGVEVANFMIHLDNYLENTFLELLVNVHVDNNSSGRSKSGEMEKTYSYE